MSEWTFVKLEPPVVEVDHAMHNMAEIETHIFRVYGLRPQDLVDDGSNGSSQQARNACKRFRAYMRKRFGVQT